MFKAEIILNTLKSKYSLFIPKHVSSVFKLKRLLVGF